MSSRRHRRRHDGSKRRNHQRRNHHSRRRRICVENHFERRNRCRVRNGRGFFQGHRNTRIDGLFKVRQIHAEFRCTKRIASRFRGLGCTTDPHNRVSPLTASPQGSRGRQTPYDIFGVVGSRFGKLHRNLGHHLPPTLCGFDSILEAWPNDPHSRLLNSPLLVAWPSFSQSGETRRSLSK